MCKMSTGVAALFIAGLVGLACSDQTGLNPSGSGAGSGEKGGQAGSAVGGRTAGGSGGTIGTGGVVAGGPSGTGGCPLLYCPAIACPGGNQPTPQPCGCPICGPNPAGAAGGGAGGAIGTGGTTPTGGTTGTGGCPLIACPAIACLGDYQPNPDPCGCPICATDGGTATDGGKKDAASICPPINCPMLDCVGGTHPSPDPCGCPLCGPAPDAGVAKDAGRADTKPICLPVACPAIACVGGTHPNPDPCGCPLCGPTPDAGVAKDAGPPTACPMLASLNSTDATQVNYSAARALVQCTDTGGTSSVCVSNDITTCPGSALGAGVSCRDLCAANQYGLAYGGVGPLAAPPSIEPPAGCGPGMYTPGGVAFYCCPCGT
jgi:hypothetical protein